MRSSFSKPLKSAFEDSLKQRIKTAVRVPMPSPSPGSLAWLVGEDEKTAAYVILFVSPRDDRFTIELAWSLKKRIPDRNDMMPGGEGETGELRFRLSRLWQPHGFEVWYDLQYDADYPDSGPYAVSIPEQPCLDRIPGKVKRALDALEAHGIPYLKNAVGLPVSHADGVPLT
jgi:hypothetical protein